MKKKLLLIFLVFLVYGCNSDQQKGNNDEDTSESVPFVDVPRGNLPEWLNEWIDLISPTYVGKPLLDLGLGKQATIHRGTWKGNTVYRVWTLNSSCLVCFLDQKGESISFTLPSTPIDPFNDNFSKILPGSKNWELIFLIKDGVVKTGGIGTRSSLSANNEKITDKYIFPDISGMNDWKRPDIIQERLVALQIPDALLANISTEGLLETCLDFPYSINIFFANDYQQGFNGLTELFNGYRELLAG